MENKIQAGGEILGHISGIPGAYGWHFLNRTLKLGYNDGRKAAVGMTLSVPPEEKVILCGTGMHACHTITEALLYKKGLVLTRVHVSGDLVGAKDKFAGRHRTVLWLRPMPKSVIAAALMRLGPIRRRISGRFGPNGSYVRGLPITSDRIDSKHLIDRVGTLSAREQRVVESHLKGWALTNGAVE